HTRSTPVNGPDGVTRLVERAPVTPPRRGRAIRAGGVIGANLRVGGMLVGAAGAEGAAIDGAFGVAGVVMRAPVAAPGRGGAALAVFVGGTSFPANSVTQERCRSFDQGWMMRRNIESSKAVQL
ncbi:hypothetical protein ACHAXS_008620, partial [Conticribra weissflogii]